jgi:DNA polymerase-1
MDQRKTVAVIDGNSLMHRAFHAVPPSMVAPDGTPTNAVFGFVAMFVKLAQDFEPWGIAVCFDKGKPKVRMEMLPQYKAQRPPMDPALRPQFPLVKDLLASMCVPVVELEGWEGDDLLGTLSLEGETQGYDMLLVTGDRDMYQLSSDHVRIVSTRKGMSDVSIMTPESVADLYGGITPDLVPDFYGLKGDSSDNIPGVPGIGPKKAAALIEQYGSLDGVIEHAGEVKGKMGENLRAHIEDALLSRKVATIRRDAPVDFDFASAEFPVFDPAVVREAFGRIGFSGVNTRRVLDLARREDPAASAHAAPARTLDVPEALPAEKGRALVADAVALGRWCGVALGSAAAPAAASGQLALSVEDASAPAPLELFVASDGKLARFEGDEAVSTLANLLETGRVAAIDAKAAIEAVCPRDSAIPAALDPARVEPANLFDCQVAAYLLDSTRASYPCADLVETYLGLEAPASPDAAYEASAALALKAPLEAALAAGDAEACYRDIELPLIPVLAAMERAGMQVDPAILARQSAELKGELDHLAARIHDEAGETFNIASPKKLSEIMFGKLGYPTTGLKKTKSGYYSTNAKVLEDLARDHQFVRDVLEWREKTKIRSTYLEALPDYILADKRIHTTLNQTVTATGRLSSSDPNLQNIPVRSELGRRVREAFTVPEGSVFLAVDYSQIELRLLAHLSGDAGLVAAFRSGEDFHAETAARVFGVPVSEVTPELRSRAKAVNFGIVYGQQAYGLSQSLGIPMAEAQRMIDSYYAAYPGVRAYLDRTVAEAKADGYATTMFGRRRYVPDILSRNPQTRMFGERTAMNHPMQGSAADIIKIAMARVERALSAEKLESTLILQIHDELDLQVPEKELEHVTALVKTVMEGVVELAVPLVVDASWGATWAEAK